MFEKHFMHDVISAASFVSLFKVDETLLSCQSRSSLIFSHSFHTMKCCECSSRGRIFSRVTILWTSCERPRPIEIYAQICLGHSQLIHRRGRTRFKNTVQVLLTISCFFQNPITDFCLPIINLRRWFTNDVVRNKRSEIAKLIRELVSILYNFFRRCMMNKLVFALPPWKFFVLVQYLSLK
jgi:hypothetical protein